MKLFNSYYIPETGESQVTLVNRYGKYTGMAFVHPDDKETASQFAGCRLAERRAWVKALQSDIRRYKLQRKALVSFAIDLTNMVQEVPENVRHRLDVHLAKYNKDIADTQEAIRILKQQEKTDIELREKILQRAKEKQ